MSPPRPELVRRKLDAGLLPTGDPVRLWAGYGHNRPCHVCDEPVLPTQAEYEFDTADGRSRHVHADCYRSWEAERRRGLDPPDASA